MISNVAYTMEKLKTLANESNGYSYKKEVELETVKEKLKLIVEEKQNHSKLQIV